MSLTQLETLARDRFGLEVEGQIRELHAGNINRSAVVQTADGHVVLQEMNAGVFLDVHVVMDNIAKIIDALHAHNLPALTFLRSVDGALAVVEDGVPWRCYRYVDGTATPPITTPDDAQATARAFGRYARAIESVDLVEHLLGYHDFDARITAFEYAVKVDETDRLRTCEPVVEQLMTVVDKLRLSSGYDAWGEAPLRNAHNDAKGPNCIVGPTGARTIIDLDTTMPGTLLSDIGELVRSSTRAMTEAGPEALMAQIEAVNRGFLAGYGGDLNPVERNAMLLAGPLMTIENAARFVADHLNGDKYYGASSPNQNLDRGEVQLALAIRLIDAIEWATAS